MLCYVLLVGHMGRGSRRRTGTTTSPVLGWVDCDVLGRVDTRLLIVLPALPEYGGDCPFLVSPGELRQDGRAVRAQLRFREGDNWVVDMPGEALNFGPRLLVPAERVLVADTA